MNNPPLHAALIRTTTIAWMVATLGTIQAEETSSDYAFPSYRGDGTGAPPRVGVPLVDSWKDATVKWRSEEQVPPLTPITSNEFPGGLGHGGYASPIVGADRIYITYWYPTGPVLLKKGHDKGRHKDSPKVKVNADEIVVCMDLETGKTIWRTVYESAGWNFTGMYPSDGQITPTLADGRLFFLGSLGRAYCLDAETGKKLWDKPSGRMARLCETHKKYILDGKAEPSGKDMPPPKWRMDTIESLLQQEEHKREQGGSGGGAFNASPLKFGDVVVFNAYRDAVAYDVATGEERWRVEGCFRTTSSPARLTLEDKDYLFCNPGGQLIDPSTGEVLSQVRLSGYHSGTPATQGAFAITTCSGHKSYYVACLELTAEGLVERWRLPNGTATGLNSPVILGDRAYLAISLPKGELAGMPEEARQAMLPVGYSGPEPQTERRKFTVFPGEGGGEEVILCVELQTGKVLGVNAATHFNSLGAMPFGMEDRYFYGSQLIFDAEPDERGILKCFGNFPERRKRPTRCTTFTGKGGLLFVRVDAGPELVRCYDMRRKQ